MGSLGGGGGGMGMGGSRPWWNAFSRKRASSRPNHNQNQQQSRSKSSNSIDGGASSGKAGYRFPINQALTAGALALTGDTIAQVNQRLKSKKVDTIEKGSGGDKGVLQTLILEHDWVRSLRMTSYGFLLYGPGSYAWYQLLERTLPQQNVKNLLLKVFLNQVVLGPSVIAVVFAWNNLWLGKIKELPKKYQNDALPTLLLGLKFWIPVSLLNFWVVPLPARVAFMSTGSIFWNFCLSSTMSK